jgi:hypothetical protein
MTRVLNRATDKDATVTLPTKWSSARSNFAIAHSDFKEALI